jgi:hypothetical protein
MDGSTIVRYHLEGSPEEPEMLGAAMVDRLLDLGAADILAEVRSAAEADGGRVDSLLET